MIAEVLASVVLLAGTVATVYTIALVTMIAGATVWGRSV